MKELLKLAFDAGQNYRAGMLKQLGKNTSLDFDDWSTMLSHDLIVNAIDNYLEKRDEERINIKHYEMLEEIYNNRPG